MEPTTESGGRVRPRRRPGAATAAVLTGLIVATTLALVGAAWHGAHSPMVGTVALRGAVGPSPEEVPVEGVILGAPAPGAAYGWPLGPPAPTVVRPFAAPAHRFGPGHRGVDLTGAPGAAVLAAAAGVVVFAGLLAGRGVVSVQHPDGLRTTYEPVTPSVRAGATLVRGDVLGALVPGHVGCPAACLHWGVRRDRTTYVDPLRLLAPPHVRLLPLPDPWPDGFGGGGESVRPGDAPGRAPPSGARR